MSKAAPQARKIVHSEVFLKAEKLGQLVRNQRGAVTADTIRNVFDYLDFDNKHYITIPVLTGFLTQCGIVADDISVYNEILRYRESRIKKDEYFEKPSMAKVMISPEEFSYFMLCSTFTSKELQPIREAFELLEKITPSLRADQPGTLKTNVLFRELQFWGIMTHDEIEQIRPFFGILPDRKTMDVINAEKILARVCLD